MCKSWFTFTVFFFLTGCDFNRVFIYFLKYIYGFIFNIGHFKSNENPFLFHLVLIDSKVTCYFQFVD